MPLAMQSVPIILMLLASACNPGIIHNKSPFFAQDCSYVDIDKLVSAAVEQARDHHLKSNVQIFSKDSGAFSILMVGQGINVVMTGVPDSRVASYLAIAENEPSAAQRLMVSKMLQSLPCSVHDDEAKNSQTST